MVDWKVFQLTYVVYEKGNKLSQLFALLTLSPLFIVAGLAAVTAVTRSIRWAWTLLSVVVVTVVCNVLKDVIAQPRPPESHRDGFGMPSEHSAFCACIAMHLSLHLFLRVRCPRVLKLLAVPALWLWAVLVVCSRLHLGVHSEAQVLVGSMVGAVIAVASFTVEDFLAGPLGRTQRWVDAMWATLDIRWETHGHTD